MVIEQPKTIDAFINANHSWLQSFLSCRLGCIHDAKDVSQDTFIRVLTSSAVNLEEIKEPRAYLATIANRLILDKFRRQKLEKAYIYDHGVFLQDQYAPSSEEVLESINKLEALVKLLEGLKEKPRSAFLMSRLDGMAYKEIAVELRVSVSMVKKYIAKALLHCYDVIAGE